jgi:Putative bacterial sensory transduction regulator
MSERTITLPMDECREAIRLLVFTRGDDRSPHGSVRLTADGAQRVWFAGDDFHAAIVRGGTDREVYDVALPPDLIRYTESAADGTDTVTLTLDDTASTLVLAGPGGAMTVSVTATQADNGAALVTKDRETGGSATMRAHRLYDALNRQPRVVAGADENPSVGSPSPWLVISPQGFFVDVMWDQVGASRIQVPTETVWGEVAAPISREILSMTITLFDPAETIEIRIPLYNSEPFRIIGERKEAIVASVPNPAVVLRRTVEATIETVAGPVALNRDGDGDYPLYLTDSAVYGRLLDANEPPVLQVFAVILRNVEESPELLRELNDLNRELKFARLFLVADQVLAEVDLVAATLDGDELRNAMTSMRASSRCSLPCSAATLTCIRSTFAGRRIAPPSSKPSSHRAHSHP